MTPEEARQILCDRLKRWWLYEVGMLIEDLLLEREALLVALGAVHGETCRYGNELAIPWDGDDCLVWVVPK